MTFGTIVVGVDGSTSAARALTWAIEEAVAEHQALTLVHAVPAVAPEFIGAGIVEASKARTLMEQDGRSVLAEARPRCCSGSQQPPPWWSWSGPATGAPSATASSSVSTHRRTPVRCWSSPTAKPRCATCH